MADVPKNQTNPDEENTNEVTFFDIVRKDKLPHVHGLCRGTEPLNECP